VLAFARALEELREEGGVAARQARYTANQELLVRHMGALGFPPYLDPAYHSPIITSFLYPQGEQCGHQRFNFQELYDFLKASGFVIYPGKLTDADTFRIGTIGEIYPTDIEALCDVIARFQDQRRTRGGVRP
jgi:2-aminoethylphosphonate-pyruvate transaminase